MKLVHMLRSRMDWLGSGTVVSSRVRLARNLRGRPFPHLAAHSARKRVLDSAFEAAKGLSALAGAAFLRLDDVDELDRSFLVERHLSSRRLAGSDAGLAIGAGERLSVMVNEEDHLRLQAMAPGLELGRAFRDLVELDVELGERLPYSYDDRWGYLTACPTNVGTALRASCLVHLPALMMSGAQDAALKDLTRAGMVARGLYGEGSRVLGDLLQVSNAVSLGRSEEELLEAVRCGVSELVRREDGERDALLARERLRLEDHAHRSLGLLRSARLLDFEEAMRLLSRVRLGAALGLLEAPGRELDSLRIRIRPGHLQMEAGRELGPDERDARRAALVRDALS